VAGNVLARKCQSPHGGANIDPAAERTIMDAWLSSN
jgi:hypothetical protein